ncbi:N-acetylglucosamine-6-phosphate deacetylase [Salinifilum aidingensis]
MHSRDLVLTGARVVTPDGVRPNAWVHVAGEEIRDVGTGAPPAPATRVELSGGWLVPGFVDAHCHGGGGGSFTTADAGQIRTAIDAHRRHGTTTMLASLVSAPMPRLREQLAALREFVSGGELAGAHLEGPFLAAARCGAHAPAVLTEPEPESVEELLAAGGDALRTITLAPELPGAVEAIRRITDRGVRAAVGHTDARGEHVLPAVEAGARIATHLFNAMPPLHHREPGPVGELLADERVAVELICDLVHLHPAVARLAASAAGPARTLAVTDAISAAEAGDGTFDLGGLAVTVDGGQPRLDDGSLAGSTLTMDRAFRNLVQHCGLSAADAAAATASKPAEVLGLDARIGSIAPGKRADLVVLTEELLLRHVMRAGTWLD